MAEISSALISEGIFKNKALNSAISIIKAISNNSISNEFEAYKINTACIKSEHMNCSYIDTILSSQKQVLLSKYIFYNFCHFIFLNRRARLDQISQKYKGL